MKLNIGYRVTVNLGNYESFQYNIGIEVETELSKMEKLKEKIEAYLESEIIEKVKELKKNGREKYGFDTTTFNVDLEDIDE